MGAGWVGDPIPVGMGDGGEPSRTTSKRGTSYLLRGKLCKGGERGS